MKLEYIMVENFRQFYGEQEAEFATESDLNVTVFHGLNGAGKTSLFSAITWCLYQNVPTDIGDLINRRAVSETDEGNTVKAKVTIWFRHQGSRYIATRTLLGKKVGVRWEQLGDSCTFTKMMTAGSVPIMNYIDFVNSVLPENVRPYFFFDGEKMDDLTRAESTDVENAIRNFIRLPALLKAKEHLDSVATEFRRGLKTQATGELQALIGREDQLRAEKTQTQQIRDEVKEQIRVLREQITEIDNKLIDSEQAKELQTEREHCLQNIKSYEETEHDSVQAIQKNVNRVYAIYLSDCVQKALSVLDEKRQKGEVPSGIREQLIKDLIESKECICGRSFHEDDEVYKRLQRLLRHTASDELETKVSTLGGQLRAFAQQVSYTVEAIDRDMKSRAKAQQQMGHLRDQVDNLSRRLKAFPLEEIAGLEKRRISFNQRYERYLQDLGQTEQRLINLDKDIESIHEKQKQQEAQQGKLKLQSHKVELSQRAADAIDGMTLIFKEEARKNVEIVTKQIFNKLAWKQAHFNDVTLSGDFHMEVIDQWGLPTRKELSAGERQILSLSFICAMAKVAGEEAPLVMDTPFGRLSGNHLINVAQNLPDLCSQLILFVTDREWDEASKTSLEPRTGAQYCLVYDDKSGCTQLEEVSY
jgi:DNA sulfur modification protein DndD